MFFNFPSILKASPMVASERSERERGRWRGKGRSIGKLSWLVDAGERNSLQSLIKRPVWITCARLIQFTQKLAVEPILPRQGIEFSEDRSSIPFLNRLTWRAAQTLKVNIWEICHTNPSIAAILQFSFMWLPPETFPRYPIIPYLYSGLTKSTKVFGSSYPWWSCPWSCEWGSSSGPTYSIFKTLPHSGQRSTGRSRDIYTQLLASPGIQFGV